MTVLWLFIISYVTSVIHGENHRLELALQKVSATSQNVPEALQKWHETSKSLEQNQTALNGTLLQMQQILSKFHTELKQLRDSMDKKNENSQEAQLNRLQSSVADLGSSIGDSNSRIGALEERLTAIQTEQKQLNKSLEDLQKIFGHIQNTTSGAAIIGGDEVAKGVEKTIAELREQLTGQLNNLAQNVTGELEALRQKNVWLATDLANQTKRIEGLVEDKNNISSHVSSIQAVWLEIRNNMTTLEADQKTINEQLAALANVTTGLHGTIATVQVECQQYHSKLDGVNGKLGALQDQIQQIETKEAIHLSRESSNGTQQIMKDNMSPLLSQLFAEHIPPATVSTNPPVTPKSTEAATPTTTTTAKPQTSMLYPGTLVLQMSTTPQPNVANAGPAQPSKPNEITGTANADGSVSSKKAPATFDSVM
ncbi:uncharacterized protein LOC131290791 isoform X2 [Anopheles ziemanni]|nr:uncharacterized protein LOC131290791 isoform X2 [Anopheles ziemanni]